MEKMNNKTSVEVRNILKSYETFNNLDKELRDFIVNYFHLKSSVDYDDALGMMEEALTFKKKVDSSKSKVNLTKMLGENDFLNRYIAYKIISFYKDEEVDEYININLKTLDTLKRYSNIEHESKYVVIMDINEKVKGKCLINEHAGQRVMLLRTSPIDTSSSGGWATYRANFSVVIL